MLVASRNCFHTSVLRLSHAFLFMVCWRSEQSAPNVEKLHWRALMWYSTSTSGHHRSERVDFSRPTPARTPHLARDGLTGCSRLSPDAELWLRVKSQAGRQFAARLMAFCWRECKWGFPLQTIPHVTSLQREKLRRSLSAAVDFHYIFALPHI